MATLFYILSGFYVLWLICLLTVAYTPRLFQNYTLFKAVNSILFVAISVAAWRHSTIEMNAYCFLPRCFR